MQQDSASNSLPKLQSHADMRRSPVRRAPMEKTLVRDEELFHEGDLGKEVYLLKTGEVAVLKGEGTEQIELTRLGPGAVIGEMALLDNQSRSATIKATQKSQVTIISEAIFVSVLKTLPSWLLAILKVISNRLRSANSQLSGSITNDVRRSLAFYFINKQHLAQCLAANEPKPQNEYFACLDEFTFQTRCSKAQFNEALSALSKVGFLKLVKDKDANRIIQVPDLELLDIYCEFRTNQALGKKTPALHFSKAHEALLHFIIKIGKQEAPGLPVLHIAQEEFLARLDQDHPSISNLEISAIKDALILKPSTDGNDFIIDLTVATRMFKIIQNARLLTMED
jgi:CRP-like cAMP-binding protein